MAGWITHMAVADRLFQQGLPLDAKGFCAGSIAPDCNVENEDWTVFIPPREVTHWMTGDSKLTADYEAFYEQRICGKCFDSVEELSFYLGYYIHLMTDVEWMRFLRNPQRVSAAFSRLRAAGRIDAQDGPETFEMLKQMFGRKMILKDAAAWEEQYVLSHPQSFYHTVLKQPQEYCDEWAGLPHGAIRRKIQVMLQPAEPEAVTEGLFFTKQEIEDWLHQLSASLMNHLQKRKAVI